MKSKLRQIQKPMMQNKPAINQLSTYPPHTKQSKCAINHEIQPLGGTTSPTMTCFQLNMFTWYAKRHSFHRNLFVANRWINMRNKIVGHTLKISITKAPFLTILMSFKRGEKGLSNGALDLEIRSSKDFMVWPPVSLRTLRSNQPRPSAITETWLPW